MDVPAPLQVEFQQSSLYGGWCLRSSSSTSASTSCFHGGVYSQCKLCITVEIPQVLFLDWCRVVTVLITVRFCKCSTLTRWTMSLLCRFIWLVQSLDKVVDMPVIVNDSDCKQWKCLKFHRRQRQWQLFLVLLVLHFALRSTGQGR